MDDRYRDNLEEEELESGESFEPQYDGDDGSSSSLFDDVQWGKSMI